MTRLNVERDPSKQTSTKGTILMKVNSSVKTSKIYTKSITLPLVTVKTQSSSMLSSVMILVQSSGLISQLSYEKMTKLSILMKSFAKWQTISKIVKPLAISRGASATPTLKWASCHLEE